MKKLLFFYIICCYTNIFAHSSLVQKNKLNRCLVSKAVINDYEPEIFEPTNNLLRKTGHASKYHGQKILIRGKVLDRNCVPVSDAKVYLWHTGVDGRYPYLPLRTHTNKKMWNINSTSSFTGSGIATTNNKGEYYFVTLFPRKLPYANIRVEHYDLKGVQTRLHLTNNNICKNECGEINATLAAAENGATNYCLDIVLSGTTMKKY